MNGAFISELLLSTVRMATPILIVALAEVFSERAGLVNIGLEGLMTFGALCGFLACYISGSPALGVFAGMAGGVAMNMIFAFCTITLCAEQIVYGMALNILAPAVAAFMYRVYFGINASLPQGTKMQTVAIPVLKDIPFIGKLLFDQTPMVYFVYLMVVLSSVFFTRTKLGLNYKAVGEYPRAAETLGINVILYKYIACVICGALCGIGGAYLTTCYVNTFSEGVVAGRGFIALSAVIFGRWNAGGVLLACLLFGFCDALQLRLQINNPDTPYQLFQMIPYIATLVALAVFGIRKIGPKSVGLAYRREER
ncbi:MAG: ABC transporter permease [Clostridiales Family XIII bacterium]|jgi:simple sugar transport system permease protein|nr:ABC transporter permease [Clostridiales Family XIII bacterium]